MDTKAALQLLREYAATGNAGAFLAIVRRYQDLVYGTCLRILGDAAAAGGAAQECFLRLARRAGSVRLSLADWLHGCATFVSLSARGDGRRRGPAGRAGRLGSEARPLEATWRQVAPFVDDAAANLPDELRLAWVERLLLRRRGGELAGEMGISPAALRERLGRGMALVHRSLKSVGVGVSPHELASLLRGNLAVTAPAELAYELGKIALAGIGPAAARRAKQARRCATSVEDTGEHSLSAIWCDPAVSGQAASPAARQSGQQTPQWT
jgi:DNA-directed RNA polymerase specialized sigma24 family protein